MKIDLQPIGGDWICPKCQTTNSGGVYKCKKCDYDRTKGGA